MKLLQAVEEVYDRRDLLQKTASYRALSAAEFIVSPGYAYYMEGPSAALGKIMGLFGRRFSYVDALESTLQSRFVPLLPDLLQSPCSDFLRVCSESFKEDQLIGNIESHVGQFMMGMLGIYVTDKVLNRYELGDYSRAQLESVSLYGFETLGWHSPWVVKNHLGPFLGALPSQLRNILDFQILPGVGASTLRWEDLPTFDNRTCTDFGEMALDCSGSDISPEACEFFNPHFSQEGPEFFAKIEEALDQDPNKPNAIVASENHARFSSTLFELELLRKVSKFGINTLYLELPQEGIDRLLAGINLQEDDPIVLKYRMAKSLGFKVLPMDYEGRGDVGNAGVDFAIEKMRNEAMCENMSNAKDGFVAFMGTLHFNHMIKYCGLDDLFNMAYVEFHRFTDEELEKTKELFHEDYAAHLDDIKAHTEKHRSIPFFLKAYISEENLGKLSGFSFKWWLHSKKISFDEIIVGSDQKSFSLEGYLDQAI
ncbi:MAG: hypothetical protein GY915_02600 [bacterium]|nr:hypothetical protein [bacterium]